MVFKLFLHVALLQQNTHNHQHQHTSSHSYLDGGVVFIHKVVLDELYSKRTLANASSSHHYQLILCHDLPVGGKGRLMSNAVHFSRAESFRRRSVRRPELIPVAVKRVPDLIWCLTLAAFSQ